jgi:protein-disulfide isomerase
MTPQRLTIGTALIALIAIAAILVAPRLGASQASELDLRDNPRLGAADAPVTIAIFEDFRCPACAQFDLSVLPDVKREFVDTGQASLVFVHFPVLGPASEHVGRIGECVYRQSNDTFWEMKSPLYRAQSELDSTRRAEELALMYAPGIEEASFRACLAADDSLQRVRADRAVATGLNLRGTPSVAVNGSPLPAATLAEIRRAVEAALR